MIYCMKYYLLIIVYSIFNNNNEFNLNNFLIIKAKLEKRLKKLYDLNRL